MGAAVGETRIIIVINRDEEVFRREVTLQWPKHVHELLLVIVNVPEHTRGRRIHQQDALARLGCRKYFAGDVLHPKIHDLVIEPLTFVQVVQVGLP